MALYKFRIIIIIIIIISQSRNAGILAGSAEDACCENLICMQA